MKKYLPQSSLGFTLIELMVVVAIIAILALVSLGIFNGAQDNARDARRLAEVNALAKNIESTRDPQTGAYTYGKTLFAIDYPKGLTDPADTSKYYCFSLSKDTIVAPDLWGNGVCPTSFFVVNAEDTTDYGYYQDPPENTQPFKYFMVCAKPERTTKPICQGQFLK